MQEQNMRNDALDHRLREIGIDEARDWDLSWQSRVRQETIDAGP
jgi:hypothetical protein